MASGLLLVLIGLAVIGWLTLGGYATRISERI